MGTHKYSAAKINAKQMLDVFLNKTFISVIFALFVLLSTVTITAWIALNQGSVVDLSFKMVRYLIYILCCFVLVMMIYKKVFTRDALFFITLFIACSGICAIMSGERNVLITAILLSSIYGCNSKSLVKISMLVQGAILIVTVLLAWLGVTDNTMVDTERMRYSLGFSWTSFAPNLFLFITLQYVYLREKMKWFDYLILELVNIYFYIFTNTRMSFLLVSLFLVLHAGCTFSNHLKNLFRTLLCRFKRIVCISPLIGAMIAFFLPLYKAGSKIWLLLNAGFSGRLWQSKSGIINYGFTFFGQKVDIEGFSVAGSIGGDSNYIDSSYLQIGINYGLIILGLVLSIYVLAIVKAYRRRNFTLVSILCMVVVFSIEDPFLFDLRFNIFPIIAFCDSDHFDALPIFHRASAWLDSKYKKTVKLVQSKTHEK